MFLVLHFTVWTILPALLYANLPLDFIEALVYGREWQLGYDKLPPLPWWLIEAVHRVLGADIAYYATAQAAVLIAFALVFALSRRLVGTVGALVGILIIDGLHYFQYTAVKFNHDVIRAAVLGAGRLRLSCRASAQRPRLLDVARLRRRRRGMGKIFCDCAGAALCAVHAVRPSSAPCLGDARTVAFAVGRALCCFAAYPVAIPNRFPAVRICQSSCRADTWLVRSRAASLRLPWRSDLPAAIILIAAALFWPRKETGEKK